MLFRTSSLLLLTAALTSLLGCQYQSAPTAPPGPLHSHSHVVELSHQNLNRLPFAEELLIQVASLSPQNIQVAPSQTGKTLFQVTLLTDLKSNFPLEKILALSVTTKEQAILPQKKTSTSIQLALKPEFQSPPCQKKAEAGRWKIQGVCIESLRVLLPFETFQRWPRVYLNGQKISFRGPMTMEELLQALKNKDIDDDERITLVEKFFRENKGSRANFDRKKLQKIIESFSTQDGREDALEVIRSNHPKLLNISKP